MTSSPLTEARPTWGAGVRTLRGIKGLTQTGLAALADTTQPRISEIEKGARAVPDALRVRIARALDVDPYSLFPYVDPEDV